MLVYISPGPVLASKHKKEVKRLKITQAIEMEIKAVNHDKTNIFIIIELL